MNNNNQLPHNLEVEQSILGAMLLSPTAVEQTIHELTEQEFYSERNQMIFKAIDLVYQDASPVDPTTVLAKLESLKLVDRVGGVEYLLELADMVPAPDNVPHYINIVKDKAILRRLISVCNVITSDATGEIDNVTMFVEEAEKMFLEITRNRNTSDLTEIGSVLSKVTQRLVEMSKSNTRILGVPSGFTHLDNLTQGFQRGALIIVAARPSIGKSAFALNIAKNAASKNFTTVVFSLEMPNEQLVERIISATSHVELGRIRSGLNDDDWPKYRSAENKLENLSLYMDDASTIKVSDIYSKCLKLKQQGKLDLVVIDYLQLIAGSGRQRDNRQQEISEISRSLKTMAKELDVPIIALSQLSRAVEQRADKRPMMSDLRESGAIEQDADIIMFLYRDSYYNKEANMSDITPVEVIVAKHRNGSTRDITLSFNRTIQAFNTMIENHGGEPYDG